MKKTLAILLALCMVLGMGPLRAAAAGTAGGNGETGSPAGVYKMTGLAGNSGSNLEIVSAVCEWGVKYYLVLNEDGTGRMSFLEADIPLEWDENSILLSGHGAIGPVRLPYAAAGGSLKINTRAYSMDFAALNDEELAYFEANGSGSLGGMIGKVVQGLVERMDGGLIEGLLADLALGSISDEPAEPIPEGEPSEGPVSGKVEDMEFTILGADHMRYDGNDLIVFYYEATNRGRGMRPVWWNTFDASQDGEFLEENWDIGKTVPEQYYIDLHMYPGRTIRCASVFSYDPDGGTVGFRIGSFNDESTVIYYADPGNLSGAPVEPFVFDADPEVPEELKTLPEKTDNAFIEDVELYTSEDGPAIRFYYRFLNNAAGDTFIMALQDGIELGMIWNDSEAEEEGGENGERAGSYACRLRTGSPVVFLFYVYDEDDVKVPIAAKITELS